MMAQAAVAEYTVAGGYNWRHLAACRHVDADLFFPGGTAGAFAEHIAAAKDLCRVCPVIDACLSFALRTNQEYGVWGGTSEDERRHLRRRLHKSRREPASQDMPPAPVE